jgi:hypothetical protein
MENLEDLLARKRWTRWLFRFLCWLAIILFYSTRVPLGGPVDPCTTTLEASAGNWFVSAQFVPAIIRCDRLIKRHTESLVQRLLLHVRFVRAAGRLRAAISDRRAWTLTVNVSA